MNQKLLIRLEQAAEKLVLDIPAALDDDDYTALFNEKFAELVVQECCQYLSDEIGRLNEYRAALEREPQRNEIFIDQIDVCIDKCQDNILGLREHFGIKNEPTNP